MAFSECCPPAAGCPSTPPIPLLNNGPNTLTADASNSGIWPAGSTIGLQWINAAGFPSWPTPAPNAQAWTPGDPGPGSAFLNLSATYAEPGSVTLRLHNVDTGNDVISITAPQPGPGTYSSTTGAAPVLYTLNTLVWLVTNNHPTDATFYTPGGFPTANMYNQQPPF